MLSAIVLQFFGDLWQFYSVICGIKAPDFVTQKTRIL